MFVAKVTGSVVATQQVDELVGSKLMVVEPFRLEAEKRKSLTTTISLLPTNSSTF